jgi:hypothetical protein
MTVVSIHCLRRRALRQTAITGAAALGLTFGAAAATAQGAQGAPAPQRAQDAPAAARATPPAAAADVASVDAIVAALYDAISGPPGQARNWDRLRSLFAPSARMLPIARRPDGTFAPLVLTPDDYVARSGERLTRDGFTEREIARRAEQFGNLVHVWSTYDGRFTAPGVTAPPVRGINSLQLMNDGTRWWILSLSWQAESADLKLPSKYLTS